MKRKLKFISLIYVLPSDRTLDILEIGPLYNSHTQLNVCEEEELQCFLYLIQIFDLNHNGRQPLYFSPLYYPYKNILNRFYLKRI